MQNGMRLNDGHVTYLGLLAKKDGARKGYLSKRSSDNTKWHTKWFALLQNMLFYFETDSSSRPSGLYLLEGCVCDRAPSPKPSLSAKDSLEKQVGARGRPTARCLRAARSRLRVPRSPRGAARPLPTRDRGRGTWGAAGWCSRGAAADPWGGSRGEGERVTGPAISPANYPR